MAAMSKTMFSIEDANRTLPLVRSIVAEEDLVAARLTWRGTHQGEFMGIPGTGNAIELSGMDFVRFRDGKAAEHWGQTDVMALMTQLGAMEQPS